MVNIPSYLRTTRIQVMAQTPDQPNTVSSTQLLVICQLKKLRAAFQYVDLSLPSLLIVPLLLIDSTVNGPDRWPHDIEMTTRPAIKINDQQPAIITDFAHSP